MWAGTNDRRLSTKVRDRLIDPHQQLFISVVTAWEFAELQQRGRFPLRLNLRATIEQLNAQILDLPARLWEIAADLPDLHRDPVDRMLIGHAIISRLPLVTGDAVMRKYPVEIFW